MYCRIFLFNISQCINLQLKFVKIYLEKSYKKEIKYDKQHLKVSIVGKDKY